MSLQSLEFVNVETNTVFKDNLLLQISPEDSRNNCGYREGGESNLSDEEDLLGFHEINKQMLPVQKPDALTNHPKKKFILKSDPLGKTFLEFNSKLVIIDKCKWPQKPPLKQEIKEEIIDIDEEPVKVEETPKPMLISVRKGLMKSPVPAKPKLLKPEPSSSTTPKLLKKEVNIVKKTLNVIPVEGSKHSYKVLPNFDPKKNLVYLSKDQFNKEVADKNMVCKKEGSENIVVLKKSQQNYANVLEIYTKVNKSIVTDEVDGEQRDAAITSEDHTDDVSEKKYNIRELMLENSNLIKHTKSLLKIQQNLRIESEMRKKDFMQLQEDLKSATGNLNRMKSELETKEEDIKQLKETIKNMKDKTVPPKKVSVEIQTNIATTSEATQTDNFTVNSNNEKFLGNISPETEIYRHNPVNIPESLTQNPNYLPQIPVNPQIPAPNFMDVIDDKLTTLSGAEDSDTNYSFSELIKYDGRIIGDNVNMGNGPTLNLQVNNPNNPDALWARLGPEQKENLKLKLCYQFCDQQINTGDFPIHVAIKANNLAAVKRQCNALSEKKVPVDIENIEGLTPLNLAILHHSDPEIISVLIENGADFSATDKDGNNAFHLSALNSYLPILEENGIMSKIDLESINNYNYDGSTPLILCGIENKHKEAEILIKYKAKVDMQDKKSGRTALFHAIESDALETVRVLLNNGADKLIRNFSGINAQEVATELEKVNKSIRNLLNGTEQSGSAPKAARKRPKFSNEKLETVAKRVKM